MLNCIKFINFYSKIYDDNGDQLGKFTGDVFRPPIIMSSGPSILIRFFANGNTGFGYRGTVRYLSQEQANNNTVVYTNCGGFVESLGGAITMMNLVANDSKPMWFDCIWIIKPPNSYMHMKTHTLLGVDAFERMGMFRI